MRYTALALTTVLTCAAAPGLEARVSLPGFPMSTLSVPASTGTQIVKIKEHKEKKANKENKGKGGDNKKVKNAQKKKPDNSNDDKTRDKSNVKIKRSKDERARHSDEILHLRAPEGRDMRGLLGAGPLVLLGSNVIFADVPDDRRLRYRNCPPGLAKKNPPCVPPGLAKKGVSYDEWITYDDDRLDAIYLDRRRDYLNHDVDLYDDNLLLNSAQIESLYGLRPTPVGKRYALIDGQPVLLSDDDYTSLLHIHDLASVANLPAGLRVAPTAALTQNELRQTYRLPVLEPGYNYAVVNGELVTLQDSAFETLQLIRIVRSIF